MIASQRTRWTRRSLLTTGLSCVGVASIATYFARAKPALAAEEVVLEEARSAYNHIVVTERGTTRTMYFVVDGTYYIESRVDLSHELSLDLDYTRTMMAGFVVQPTTQRLLMIGFGGGQITNYLYRRFPQLEIDAIDIDPEVIRLARRYFGVPDSPRYRTYAADGRLFVEQASAQTQWDMIMLDAFRGVFVPLHLKTLEYYEVLKAHLSADGVVVANLHNATPMYPNDRVTFAEVFSYNYAFAAEHSRQTVLVASAATQPIGVYELRAHARALAPHFDFDLSGLAARWYLHRDFDPSAKILHDDFAATDSESGAQRHNRRCDGSDCPYRMQ